MFHRNTISENVKNMANELLRLEGSDIEKIFIVTSPYGKKKSYPSTTRILSTVDIIYTDLNNTHFKCLHENQIFSEDAEHAEDNFCVYLNGKINDLEERNYKILNVEVKLVQNYSPCDLCARKILDYQQNLTGKEINFTLKITFANFYKHYRQENLKGLVNLLQNNIALELLQGEAAWKAFLSDKDFVHLWEDREGIDAGLKLLERAISADRKKRENVDLGMMKILKVLAKR